MDKQPVNPLAFTPNEIDAMYGLSWAAQLIYMRCIRLRINYKSAIAGCHDFRLSWQRFRDEIEVIRPPRSKKKSHEDKPSRQFIRERLKELETAGLIVTKPNPKNKPFSIFFLPLTPTGQIRLAEEQPLIWPLDEPDEETRLIYPKQCGPQVSQQPKHQPQHQPHYIGVNSVDCRGNVVDMTGLVARQEAAQSKQEQPSEQPQQQPANDSRLVSTESQGLQAAQQPPKPPQEQPYLYLRKKEIEGMADLDQQKKERIFLVLDRLAKEPKLHSVKKHSTELDTLLFEKELTFDELRHILNTITDEQFSIHLISNQLKFVRQKQEPAHQVKPKATPKPKQADKKPDNSVKINELNSELKTLNMLITNSPDNQDLINQKTNLETQLDQLRQA